jgi:putative transcriptional regulator
MKKRKLFDELMAGVQDMKSVREGKITLRSFSVEAASAPVVTAEELIQLRDRLHVSRAVFARYLRTNARTVEGWEQGRAKPNAQAALLIKLVEKYPETVEHLASV